MGKKYIFIHHVKQKKKKKNTVNADIPRMSPLRTLPQFQSFIFHLWCKAFEKGFRPSHVIKITNKKAAYPSFGVEHVATDILYLLLKRQTRQVKPLCLSEPLREDTAACRISPEQKYKR